MITGTEARTILKQVGITQKKCSKETGILEPILSGYLNNDRDIPHSQKIRLEEYIEKIKVIL